jgi:cytochrome c-type biogenesis protein CcmF
MTVLGQLALWLALLLGVWGTVVGFVGGATGRPELIRSARRTAFALLAVLFVAALSLIVALLKHDFNVAYVASYTSRDLPTVYTLTAFYGGQNGSLLFWAFVLSIFAAAAQWLTPSRYRDLMPYVAGVTSAVTLFFVVAMVFAGNPFQRLPFTPVDGNGLNPQLQNPGMAVHPPMLYLGYISITIPFAFAVAALLSKRLDAEWIHAIRKWTLVSWIFLSIGITLGMWWAYVELGWGGYWAWDPVENASFLPWLTMTAFLHSVMIQEKRGMLKKWNVVLVVISFMLSIFGTFITRSGIISSVHSFTASSLGYFFLVFLCLAAVLLTWLLWTRLPLLESDGQLESMLSREASFLFNNLLLVGIAFSILWGTMFPIVSELVRGTQITVGPPFFNRVNIPLGLMLLATTGIGPLIAWRKASARNLQRHFAVPVTAAVIVGILLTALGMRTVYAILTWAFATFVAVGIGQEFWRGMGARHRLHGESYLLALGRLFGRNRRRYGGYVVHVGIVIYFIGFSGMAFQRQQEASLKPGESVTVQSAYGRDYTFTHLGVSQYNALNRHVTAASVEVHEDGKRLGVIQSEKRQHFRCRIEATPCPPPLTEPVFQPSTEAGIRSGLREDVYIVFAGAVSGTEEAVYRFTLTPLVWWVWFGGAVLVLGGAIVMWPGAGSPASRSARRPLEGYVVKLALEEEQTTHA